MFEHLSDQNVELFLWEKGTTIHKMSSKERSELIKSIYSSRVYLSLLALNHFVGYVMHSYYYNMSVCDRRYVIKLLLDSASFDLWGDRVEMLGILYKGAPRDIKGAVWDYIYNGVDTSVNNDADCIAFCNAVRYVFDEIPHRKQLLLYNKLLYLKSCYCRSPLVATLDYTLNNVSKILK